MNKTVLVTGSSRGIGKAIIIEFAKNGYNVVINYLTREKEALKLKEYVIKNYGVKALACKCDVSSEKDVKKMVSYVIGEFKKIDILVNNAVYENDETYVNKTKKDFLKTFEVNVFGAFNVIKQLSKYMNNGIVVNISSRDSIDTYSSLTIDYSASKAAINSITQSFSLAIPEIKFIALLLPWVNTESTKEMFDEYLESELKRNNQKKLLEPKEVAEKIYQLVNDDNLKSGSVINMEV